MRQQFWTYPARGIGALIVSIAMGMSILPAAAQQRTTPIPGNALHGDITFNGTPDILINGKAARLAPGASVTDRNNLQVVPGAIKGVSTTRYTIEAATGVVTQVWILNAREIAEPRKTEP